MTIKSKILIISAALIFSVGILSIGYSYWTDTINIEGSFDVQFCYDVINDIDEVIVTPDELLLTEIPIKSQGENDQETSQTSDAVEPNTDQTIESEPIVQQPTVTIPDMESDTPEITDPDPSSNGSSQLESNRAVNSTISIPDTHQTDIETDRDTNN